MEVSDSRGDACNEKKARKKERGSYLPVQPGACENTAKDQKNESKTDAACISHMNK